MEPKDTPTGEPVKAPVTEPSAPPAAPAEPVTPPDKKETADERVSREEYEAAVKEAEKAKMRANQLENEAKDRERRELTEKEDYRTLAEKLQAELEEAKSAVEEQSLRAESEKFRENVLGSYPENVQKAARALIAKDSNNLSWKDADTWDDAKAQLTTQLDTLAEVLGAPSPDGKPSGINPNNPLTNKDVDLKDLSLDELRKILPNSNRVY